LGLVWALPAATQSASFSRTPRLNRGDHGRRALGLADWGRPFNRSIQVLAGARPACYYTTRMRMHLLTLVMHGPLPNPSHLSNQPTQSTTTHRTRRKDAAEKRPAVPQLPGRGQRLHPGGPRAPAGRPGEFLGQHASIMHGLFIHRWWMKQQRKRWHLVEGRGGALFCPLWFDERFSAHPLLLLILIVIVIVVIPSRSRGSRGPRPRPAWRSDR